MANDAKKQKCFLKGLNDGLQLQLMTVVYPDFQTLVNRAILIENKRREMEEKKRRIQSQSVGSNIRPAALPRKNFGRNQLVSEILILLNNSLNTSKSNSM